MPDINGKTWFLAALVSATMILFLATISDGQQVAQKLSNLSPGLLAGAIALLMVESLAAGWRIATCSLGKARVFQGIYTNGWYVLWLNLLPARLGEIVGVTLFRKHLGLDMGEAISSLVVQRMFDLVVLGSLFALIVLFASNKMGDALMASVTLVMFLILTLRELPGLLALSARCSLRFPYRIMTRALLQGRRWCARSKSVRFKVSLQSLLKWFANIAALSLALAALSLPLSVDELLICAVAINFLSAVPLQSLGGVGVVEAGLTGILVSWGASLNDAVAASVLLRLLILGFGLVYFVTCLLAFRMLR